MVLSRLWVNIKQGECNTIVFIGYPNFLGVFARNLGVNFGGEKK